MFYYCIVCLGYWSGIQAPNVTWSVCRSILLAHVIEKMIGKGYDRVRICRLELLGHQGRRQHASLIGLADMIKRSPPEAWMESSPPTSVHSTGYLSCFIMETSQQTIIFYFNNLRELYQSQLHHIRHSHKFRGRHSSSSCFPAKPTVLRTQAEAAIVITKYSNIDSGSDYANVMKTKHQDKCQSLY